MVPTTGTVRDYLLRPRAASAKMVGLAVGESEERRFFHWPLEFPEVFAADGFDCVLGNPPFLGGLKLSENLGDRYRKWLSVIYAPAGGTTDLSGYFYRRSFRLLRPHGHLGMVATNTIGQGDTRQGGLAIVLREGGNITFAHRFIKWPSAANVEVNLISIRNGAWDGAAELDGKQVPAISSRLDDAPEDEPEHLEENEAKAFIGSYVRGIGFILDPEEASQLIARDPHNRDCLFPYLNGADINTDPRQRPSRWVINFFDWPLDTAKEYPDLLGIVEKRVKPERMKLPPVSSDYRKLREFWWRFARSAVDLRRATVGFQRVLLGVK